MLTNLLLYRFAILNGLAVATAVALWWSGYLLPIFEADQSRLTIAIAALFVTGWIWAGREAVMVSRVLNASRRHGPRPACEAARDKDMAKVEWLASVSEWLVALGLLGTVVGFSLALAGVDQGAVSSANGAQAAVTALLRGMRVALNTTLLGAALALWHEVNVRMLKTGLTVYWADRIAAWQMGLLMPAGRPLTASIWHRADHGPTFAVTAADGKPSILAETPADQRRVES